VDLVLWSSLQSLQAQEETYERTLHGLDLVADYVCQRRGYKVIMGDVTAATAEAEAGDGAMAGSSPGFIALQRIEDTVGARVSRQGAGVPDLGGISVGVGLAGGHGMTSARMGPLDAGLSRAVGKATACLTFARRRLGGCSTKGWRPHESKAEGALGEGAGSAVPAGFVGADGLFNPPTGSAAAAVMGVLRRGMAESAVRAEMR